MKDSKVRIAQRQGKKAIRNLEKPFLNFTVSWTNESYNFSDEPWAFSEPNHSGLTCY